MVEKEAFNLLEQVMFIFLIKWSPAIFFYGRKRFLLHSSFTKYMMPYMKWAHSILWVILCYFISFQRYWILKENFQEAEFNFSIFNKKSSIKVWIHWDQPPPLLYHHPQMSIAFCKIHLFLIPCSNKGKTTIWPSSLLIHIFRHMKQANKQKKSFSL